MGRRYCRSLLSQQIADIIAGQSRRSLICTGAAMAALVPVQAGAVALGDITIESALGQPFQATVPVRTVTGEMLTPDCISATGGNRADLASLQQPGVRTPQTSQPGLHTLTVTTRQPVYEPMYELRLKVQCPGTPVLVRHYVLMLDLPGLHTLQPEITAQRPPVLQRTLRTAESPAQPSLPSARNATARTLPPDTGSIPAGSSYRVTSGDTLSTIAERVEGRPPNSIWWLADQIAVANPHAFIRNDPDLIKLGTMIRIPAASSWQTGATATKPASASTPRLPASPAFEQAQSVEIQPVAAAMTEATETIVEPQLQISALPDSPAPAFMPEMPAISADAADAGIESGTVTSSPFLDDQVALPTTRAENTRAQITQVPTTQADATSESRDIPSVERPDPAPVVTTEGSATGTRSANPLIAVAVGILLGLILSGLLLRDHLLARLGWRLNRLIRVHKASTSNAAPGAELASDDTLTDLFAETENDREITTEVEQPVISAEPALESIAEPESVGELVFAATSEQATMVGTINPVDSELAYLFDEDPAADDGHATGNIQSRVVDIGEEFRDKTTAQTEELPDAGDANSVGPTQQLPSQGSDKMHPDIDLDDTSDIDLNSLASSAVDDDKLSATLQEALTLLEKDYEEELTASQIVTFDCAEEALKDESLENGPGNSGDLPKREGTG